MRTLALGFIVLLGSTLASADTAEDRHQSYISYDSGGTVVTVSFDQREISGRVNLPIFAGDEVRTDRGGRTEVRLSDGNVVALGGSTGLRFHAIYDSYEGSADQTVLELLFGQTIIHRVDDNGQPLRLDTASATYVSDDFSLYSVEAGERGGDHIAVFGGVVEVRTRQGTTRLRSGERGDVNADGTFRIDGLARAAMSDLERWYLRRADRYNGKSSRYLDRRFAYADSDFDSYGSWVYVQDYSSWVWRPRVSVGWRPYYYGQWAHGPSGSLVWVSDEPWGWVPYHYGRWALSPLYGWIWVPGSYYSPAWVYWLYGPSYIGWTPAGWYDCYRPYYPWLYRHYTPRFEVGFGFWGRIRLGPNDLDGWVVMDSNRVVSTRVDRAALTTDLVRNRLMRDGDSATFTNTPARFTHDELRDPTTAVRTIARRGVGGGTGTQREGSPADMTNFFRRDPDLSTPARENIVRSVVRDRGVSSPAEERSGAIVRGRDGSPASGTAATTPRDDRGGPVSRDPSTGSESTSRERVTRPSPGSSSSAAPGHDRSTTAAPSTREPSTPRPDRTRSIAPRADQDRVPDRESWRGTTTSPDSSSGESGSISRSRGVTTLDGRDGWRGAILIGRETPDDGNAPDRSSPAGRSSSGAAPPPTGEDWRSSAPVPRRVIDSIGGSRVVTPDRGDAPESTSRSRGSTSSSSSSGTRERTVRTPSDSSSSTGSVRVTRPAPSRPERASSPPPSSSSTSSSPPPSRPSTSSKPSSSSSSRPNRVERSKPHGE